jgi:hypothetical protein
MSIHIQLSYILLYLEVITNWVVKLIIKTKTKKIIQIIKRSKYLKSA